MTAIIRLWAIRSVVVMNEEVSTRLGGVVAAEFLLDDLAQRAAAQLQNPRVVSSAENSRRPSRSRSMRGALVSTLSSMDSSGYSSFNAIIAPLREVGAAVVMLPASRRLGVPRRLPCSV